MAVLNAEQYKEIQAAHKLHTVSDDSVSNHPHGTWTCTCKHTGSYSFGYAPSNRSKEVEELAEARVYDHMRRAARKAGAIS